MSKDNKDNYGYWFGALSYTLLALLKSKPSLLKESIVIALKKHMEEVGCSILPDLHNILKNAKNNSNEPSANNICANKSSNTSGS